ncbi:MurR/RpiR family transcriptional regulator [Microbacterium sp. ZXX196]|uniref:MurR/RpiR family transcriptional regulator n=1 Tax=Microbacterium sp. ZXX196 TaxID=2609291 RepID=UPI0012B96F6C|nr:MurR/RpiR family transcriptional regulator [Microbacterium sp. ZXX196]MTE23310.1 SIS domain-containing protein [Microbacterium sp. ZXX196]
MTALAPSLHAGELRVAEAIAGDLAWTVERTAQEIADHVGVGRSTVVRLAQALGYDGYPQLRVAAARELALGSPDADPADGTLLGGLRASVDRFAARVVHTVSGVTEKSLEVVVSALDEAGRVLVVANGLSSPLGLDVVLRLTAAGRPAELLPDALAQRIAARQLGRTDVCLVISGSGANDQTLLALAGAREAGARVLAITSFARSAVAEASDTALIVPPVNDSFRDELVHTSRAALMLVTEALVDAVTARRGDRGRAARAAVLAELGTAIRE